MARSLSLAAYRALQTRTSRKQPGAPASRPEGELVWMHATSPGRLTVMQDVARRLRKQREDLHALITIAEFELPTQGERARGADWIIPASPDTPADVQAFLDHWNPDICLWTGGFFMPNTVIMAREKGIPMLLVDGEDTAIRSGAGRWFPKLAGQSLACFDRIFAADPDTAQRLVRRGIPMGIVHVSAPLQISSNPPETNEEEIDRVSALLADRLVWLAAEVQRDEVELVLQAHINAARLSHRLLMVMTPGPGVTAGELMQHADERQMRVVDWDAGEEPNDFTQVIIAEGEPEMGLWYRLAPVTFMGGSLTPGHGGSNPFGAAALGSAVLYGPNVRQHMSSYSRLSSAGAARIIKDADGLSDGVIRLIAPDYAASMALAAWEIVSEGAEVADQLIDLVQDYLDQGKAE